MHISRVHTEGHSKLNTLSALPQPVNNLYYRGDLLQNIAMPCVAFVGSRKATMYGKAVTTKLVQELVRVGVCIVSGLAIGIDSIAHQAALDAGGKTIAVLPSGLDYIYPARHAHLAELIVTSGGALVSEYPTGQGAPMKHQFIARNRIIAGLSQGVVITEAATKSGSLHTAQFALELGLDVFAVPGNITSNASAGTNNLVKTGAHPVTEAQDILDHLGLQVSQQEFFGISSVQQQILQILQTRPQSHKDLSLTSKLPIPELQQALTELELEGAIRQSGQQWFLV